MNAIFATDDRLAEVEADHEVDGSAFNAGRIAFHKGNTDNPYWEGGLALGWQCDAALEWLAGYEAEHDLAAKIGAPATQNHEAA